MKKRNKLWAIGFILLSILAVILDIKDMRVEMIATILIAIILLGITIEGIVRKSFYIIIIPIALNYIICQKEFNIYKINNIVIIMSAVLLSIGLSMLLKSTKTKKVNKKVYEYEKDGCDMKVNVKLGGSITYVAETFKKGYINCILGGAQVYFNISNIKDGEAVLYINSICGGVELYIPKEWCVVNDMNNLLGGINEEGLPREKTNVATLRLVGNLKLAGITIKYI